MLINNDSVLVGLRQKYPTNHLITSGGLHPYHRTR